jgi:hypothetical protein
VRLKGRELAGGNRQRSRPLGRLKLSQGWEESVQAQEGAQSPSDWLEKEIWTISFTSKRE